MKIAHISDLHFHIPELKEKLENLQHIIAEKFDFDLDITFSDEEKKEDLTKFLEQEKPNALVISGDITSFGDDATSLIAGGSGINDVALPYFIGKPVKRESKDRNNKPV